MFSFAAVLHGLGRTAGPLLRRLWHGFLCLAAATLFIGAGAALLLSGRPWLAAGLAGAAIAAGIVLLVRGAAQDIFS